MDEGGLKRNVLVLEPKVIGLKNKLAKGTAI